jgi:hypothetical protein
MAQGSSNRTANFLKSSVGGRTLPGWLRLAGFARSGKELLPSPPTAYHLRPSGQFCRALSRSGCKINRGEHLLAAFTRVHAPKIPQRRRPPLQLRLTIQQSWRLCDHHSLERMTQTYASPTDPFSTNSCCRRAFHRLCLLPSDLLAPGLLDVLASVLMTITRTSRMASFGPRTFPTSDLP